MNSLVANKGVPHLLRLIAATSSIPAYALEPICSAGDLDLAQQAVEASLRPAGKARGAAGVDYATRLLGSRPLAPDLLAGFAAILGDLPEDLLGKAIKSGCSGTTYHKLPPPGVFLTAVAEEWASRKRALSEIEIYRRRISLRDMWSGPRPGKATPAAISAAPRHDTLAIPSHSAEVMEVTSTE